MRHAREAMQAITHTVFLVWSLDLYLQLAPTILGWA